MQPISPSRRAAQWSALVCLTLAIAAPAHHASAQDPTESQPAQTLDTVAAQTQADLDSALRELAALREEIAAQKIPLAQRLREQEELLEAKREAFQRASRQVDSRTLDVASLRAEIKSRTEEANYLTNLLAEYIRNLESGMHIAELQLYRDAIRPASEAMENSDLSDAQTLAAQSVAVEASLGRLDMLLGGCRYAGRAADAEGTLLDGTFVQFGPVVLFANADGTRVGTIEQKLGSLEPAIMVFEQPELLAQASAFMQAGAGLVPIDPTLGSAHKLQATEETLEEHFFAGGPVMYPLLVLGAAGLLTALVKWILLMCVRRPSKKRMRILLEAIAAGDDAVITKKADLLPGPTGRMLREAAAHLREPRALIEEIMYERILATRVQLNRALPFIALCAGAAPLLGLLGTVTGIMNTFKLITIFGSGDVKTLSSGISEALITTEFGLVVAIPALVIHAYLSRKAKSIVDGMEAAALSFANEVERMSVRGGGGGTAPPGQPPVSSSSRAPLDEVRSDEPSAGGGMEALPA